jgi:hypothetical protein
VGAGRTYPARIGSGVALEPDEVAIALHQGCGLCRERAIRACPDENDSSGRPQH